VSKDFTHFDASGQAAMVDVSAKAATERTATARTRVAMRPETAAKRTSELIPLCHPLPISAVSLEFVVEEAAVEIAATVRTIGQTGVEMEALTAA